MLNEVVIEGWFTGKAWHYAGDLFFRLSNYRDRQRPAKPQVEGREQPDYITIRIPASGVPLALQKGALYRVHGYLQSREYKETLGDYIKSAHGLTNMLSVSDELRREITHNRAITEVVAERLTQVDKPSSQAGSTSAGNGRRTNAPEPSDGAEPSTSRVGRSEQPAETNAEVPAAV
ncbi:MAG: hypothetical protein IT317_10660 [Anaerolineales bacterium]|nr:hypothetical protein [Anaerolineales bacterium]